MKLRDKVLSALLAFSMIATASAAPTQGAAPKPLTFNPVYWNMSPANPTLIFKNTILNTQYLQFVVDTGTVKVYSTGSSDCTETLGEQALSRSIICQLNMGDEFHIEYVSGDKFDSEYANGNYQILMR